MFLPWGEPFEMCAKGEGVLISIYIYMCVCVSCCNLVT